MYAKDASGRKGVGKAKVDKRAIEKNIKSSGGDRCDINDMFFDDGKKSQSAAKRKTGMIPTSSDSTKNKTIGGPIKRKR